MKYRIKDKSESDALFTLFFGWLLLPLLLIGKNRPYVVQYKKHWWSRWKNYETNGLIACFETYEEAKEYINKLQNDIQIHSTPSK